MLFWKFWFMRILKWFLGLVCDLNFNDCDYADLVRIFWFEVSMNLEIIGLIFFLMRFKDLTCSFSICFEFEQWRCCSFSSSCFKNVKHNHITRLLQTKSHFTSFITTTTHIDSSQKENITYHNEYLKHGPGKRLCDINSTTISAEQFFVQWRENLLNCVPVPQGYGPLMVDWYMAFYVSWITMQWRKIKDFVLVRNLFITPSGPI